MSQEQSPRAHCGEFSATQRSSAVDDSVRATTIMGPSGVGGSAMAANAKTTPFAAVTFDS
jgi:hypothetical protein